MATRFNYYKLAHGGVKHLGEIEAYLHACGLESSLLELVKMRASQINGCAFCLDMHSKDARAAGETEQRLYTLDAWRETDFFSERERAALAWTEALTLIADTRAPDAVYDQVRGAIRGERNRQPLACHRRHQRLESARDRLARRGGPLQTGTGALRRFDRAGIQR
jgi:AhpD family alkylhydroperoxidase